MSVIFKKKKIGYGKVIDPHASTSGIVAGSARPEFGFIPPRSGVLKGTNPKMLDAIKKNDQNTIKRKPKK